jgi:very-short-patch-repair endonuclease
MKRYPMAGAIPRARRLRREATVFERMLWAALRERLPGLKFRRQVPFGPYIADFANHRARLIIELDGEGHAFRTESDALRTRFLEGEGYRVLRFWNAEVVENLDGVIDTIGAAATLTDCD